jgi:trimethylamine:corrinoid methyltransferase-like protein
MTGRTQREGLRVKERRYAMITKEQADRIEAKLDRILNTFGIREAMTDFNGVVAEYVYKTDDVVLPEDAQAFQFQDTEKYGWMPELVGGEWIKEDDE